MLCRMGDAAVPEASLHYPGGEPQHGAKRLPPEEMRHMDLLHGEVVRQIDRYRKAKGEPPTSMQAIYDYLHEKQIDEAKGVKEYQSMYRNV